MLNALVGFYLCGIDANFNICGMTLVIMGGGNKGFMEQVMGELQNQGLYFFMIWVIINLSNLFIVEYFSRLIQRVIKRTYGFLTTQFALLK